MKLVKRGSLIAAGAAVLALVWGARIEPRLIDRDEQVVQLPDLPPEWDGQRVALLADLQVGMWLDNTGTVRRAVSRVMDAEPAAVLIAGDFVYHPVGEETVEEAREELTAEEHREATAEIRKAVDLVRPLTEAGIPTYAVLGNHDYGMGSRESVMLAWLARDLEEALETAGIEVLQNDAARLPPPRKTRASRGGTAPLYIVGVGSHYAGRDDPREALAGVPGDVPRIVLMHHPESFAAVPADAAPLAVAGHTHGGQIRIPWTSDWSWLSLVYGDAVHADGWIDDYGRPGNRLYVNRGIGFSLMPIRINAVPQVTVFTLRAPHRPYAPTAEARALIAPTR